MEKRYSVSLVHKLDKRNTFEYTLSTFVVHAVSTAEAIGKAMSLVQSEEDYNPDSSLSMYTVIEIDDKQLITSAIKKGFEAGREKVVSDNCSNCGAALGSHRAKDKRCPLNGVKHTPRKFQESYYQPMEFYKWIEVQEFLNYLE